MQCRSMLLKNARSIMNRNGPVCTGLSVSGYQPEGKTDLIYSLFQAVRRQCKRLADGLFPDFPAAS